MSQPLDQDLARTLAQQGVSVIRDPHIGTGISKSILVDWGRLSATQVQAGPSGRGCRVHRGQRRLLDARPDRQEVDCCGPEWTAIYATRVRRMMNTYRQAGVARVYWLTLPTPARGARQQIALVVNAAIKVAAEPWLAQVRVIDTVPMFTPGNRYRDEMTIGGAADDRPPVRRHPPQRRRLGARGEARARRDRSGLHPLTRRGVPRAPAGVRDVRGSLVLRVGPLDLVACEPLQVTLASYWVRDRSRIFLWQLQPRLCPCAFATLRPVPQLDLVHPQRSQIRVAVPAAAADTACTGGMSARGLRGRRTGEREHRGCDQAPAALDETVWSKLEPSSSSESPGPAAS